MEATTMIIGDDFVYYKGTAAIDLENIYSMQGEYPVYSAQSSNDGVIGRMNVFDYNNTGIRIITVGNVGKTSLVKGKYSLAQNTGVLVPKLKEEYPHSLEYIRLQIEQWCKTRFSDNAKSQGLGETLTKADLMKVEIDLPPMSEQLSYVEQMSILKNYNDKLNLVIEKCDEMLTQTVKLDYTNAQGLGIPVSTILDCMSGNSGLTEEFIYRNQNGDGVKCRVLSGATKEDNELEQVSAQSILNGKPLKFHHGEGLLIFRKGKAGNLRYLPNGNYTMNDDAYIISVKPNTSYNINLKWLSIQYRDLFKEYSSGEGNATWNKSGFFSHAKIDIPSIDFQNLVVEQYDKSQEIKNKCLKIKNEIKKIWDFD